MKRSAHGLRKGFTLLELVVVMFILMMGTTFLILLLNSGPCGASKERGNRVRCASNLRQIGQALMIYAQNNKGAYPRVRYVPGASLAKFTKPQATNPFAEDGPAANDVTAAMFLLVRTTDLNPEVFVCPSSNHKNDTLNNLPATSRSNFTSSMNLSYSFAHPYPDEATVKMGYKFAPGVVADFVIGADRNDCVDRYKGADPDTVMSANITPMNSKNHEGEGQSILCNDGHVEWCNSPFVGANRDHIYTRHGATSGEPMTQQPENPLDTILLPTEP